MKIQMKLLFFFCDVIFFLIVGENKKRKSRSIENKNILRKSKLMSWSFH